MTELTDVPYSRDHRDRRLIDLYLPAEGNGAGILFIHGGGFKGGDKTQWREVARHFCGLGYVCGSAGYRLAPQWTFPAWVQDIRLAMAYFRSRADCYGFDPARVAAIGSSAGGYLALMLATIGPGDEVGYCDELGQADTRPGATAVYCPATSMHESRRGFPRQPYPDLMPSGEADAPDLYRLASVEDRITGREGPVLVIHGTDDDTIPHAASEDLCNRINGAGGQGRVELLEGVGHGFGYGVETDAQKASIAFVQDFLTGSL